MGGSILALIAAAIFPGKRLASWSKSICRQTTIVSDAVYSKVIAQWQHSMCTAKEL